MPYDIIIPMVCSENYLEKAFSLINSIEDNSNLNYKIYLHLVNIQPTTIVTMSNKYMVNMDKVETFFDYPIINSANKLLRVNPIFGGNIYTRFSAYCANSRVLDFKKLLDRGEKRILYMDVDSIVRSSLADLTSIIDDNDLSIHLRGCLRHPIHSYRMANPHGCAAGIIGIKNTKESVLFINNWVSLLNTNELLLHWYSEQNTANHLLVNNHFDVRKMLQNEDVLTKKNRHFFERENPPLKVYDLEQKFIDWNFDPNSPIWVGKGNKKGFEQYQEEEQAYLRQ